MTPPLFVPALGRSLYPGASVALDFTRNLYRSGTPVVKGSPSLLSGWTFTRASTGYAETAAGALVAFASGAPRITDKGLLVEEARTNLCLQSQTFDNASWGKNLVTVTTDAAVAPDGTTTAEKLICSAGASLLPNVTQSPTLTDSTDYTGSVYAKAGEFSWVAVVMRSKDSATETAAYFNLATGVVGTVAAGITATITALANGWYRCTAKKNAGVGATSPRFRVMVTTADATDTPTGDGTSGIYIWGAQLEAGAFPTSYIPTTTASATRAADVASIAYAPTFPVSMVASVKRIGGLGANCNFMYLSDGTANERVLLRIDTANTASVRQTTGGVNVATVTVATVLNALNTRYKLACRAALNDVNVATGGLAGTADTVAGVPVGVTTLGIGVAPGTVELANAYIEQAILYPYAMTDAQLQAATA